MTLSHLLFVKVMTWVVYWTDTQQVNTCLFEVLTAVFLKKTEKKPPKLRKTILFLSDFQKPKADVDVYAASRGQDALLWGTAAATPGHRQLPCVALQPPFTHSNITPKSIRNKFQLLSTDFFTYIYIFNTTLHQVSLTILISGWKFTTSVRDREKFRAQNASNSQLNNKKYISTAMVSFTFTFLALFPPALLHFSS